MQPLLQIKELNVRFHTENGSFHALKNVNLTVNRGEILAVVGESGSGKSVTALSILRLIPSPPANYDSGSILFCRDGIHTQDLLAITEEQMRRTRGNDISMIFQEPMTSLNPVYTCGRQVSEAIRLHQGLSAAAAKEKTKRLFEKVQLPDPAGMLNRYPHQLSGGQKQRVMIAMAMSCEPSLLIADEPTTALDVTVQKAILQLIRDLQRQENMGVIFITHDLGLVSELADRVAVMYNGEIVEEGLTRDVLSRPQHPYTRALLACRPALHPRGTRLPVVSDFLPGSVEDRLKAAGSKPANVGDEDRQKVAGPKPANVNDALTMREEEEEEQNKIAGSTPSLTGNVQVIRENVSPQQEVAVRENLLMEIRDLKVWFPSKKDFLGRPSGYTRAVDGVSFDIREGETLGLVGESGCGKTTLGRTLLHLVEPMAGSIRFRGKDFLSYSREQLKPLRKEIQIIFQDPYSSLNPRLSVGRAIEETLEVHSPALKAPARKEKTVYLLEKVGLQPGHYGRYPHEFSGGQRQRIGIARALALEPAFVVCDESVSALDMSVQAQVLNLLNDLKKEFGFTSVFISHDLSVVHYISDRIMVMNRGRIEEIGAADQVFHHPASEYTRQLIASIPGR